jgi:hypothetical protein
MDLLDYFRKGVDAGWVCKCAVRLAVNGGRTIRFRPGQVIYTGDFRVDGIDMVLALDMLAGPQAAAQQDRPQSISAALAA